MGSNDDDDNHAARKNNNNNSSSYCEASRLKEREAQVRNNASLPLVYVSLINLYSSIVLFLFHLVSLETLLCVALSVGLTCYTYFETEDYATVWNGSMDWVLLSFAVITPMSASISIVFTRRETALRHLTEIRATLLELYCAHASWDWEKQGGSSPSGRAANTDMNWLDHSDRVMADILSLCQELSRFLSLPQATRARHRITRAGKREACFTKKVGSELFHAALTRIGTLTLACEILKKAGLPPNEATRIRQWERMIVVHMEGLQMIKLYRSPQALRSFARLFSLLLPPFYAPFYAQLARDMNSLGVGIAFSVFTSVVLTALFDSISQMEDPFVAHLTLDGIDIQHELGIVPMEQLIRMRRLFFSEQVPEFSLDNEEKQRPSFLNLSR